MKITYCYNCMNPIEDNTGVCPYCGQAPFGVNPTHQLKTGTLLKNRYLIGKSLGQGGFGITYIGLDTMLEMRVAIKEYYPNGFSNRNHEVTDHVTLTTSNSDLYEKGKAGFLREAKTLARFYEEPGIVSVRDFFEANNTAYIVMEYLEGITLKKYVEAKGKISADVLFRVMRPLIQSLEKVHSQGIVHRDISPDNIMILRGGRLKLLDFGAARKVDGDKSLSVLLKPGYAPEEQYRSKGKQGPWTDVYSLCATMYYCLTETRPEEAVERVINDDLARPSELGAKIAPSQESVLLRGMAVRAGERYQSMRDLINAMDASAILAEREHNVDVGKIPTEADGQQKSQRIDGDALLEAKLSPENVKKAEDLSQNRTNRGRTEARHLKKTEEGNTDPSYQGKKPRKKRSMIRWIAFSIICVILIGGTFFFVTSRKESVDEIRESPAAAVQTAAPTPVTTIAPTLPPAPTDTMSAEEMLQRGITYEEGNGVEQDYTKAMEWYLKAADAGSGEAMGRIGGLYYDGRGVNQDYKEAMSWAQKAANAGDIDSLYNIATMYETGKGVTQDNVRAMEWYQRAADAGHGGAMNNIGVIYLIGNGVNVDYDMAAKWFQRGAEHGCAESMSWLGLMHEAGSLGFTQDYAKAMRWYLKAANTGDGYAMNRVGWLYQNGLGVTQDYTKAMEWYQRGADAGDSDSKNNIGYLYQYGLGAEQDYGKAMEWFQRAADAGNSSGMYNIGYLYQSGLGVEQDYGKAMEWYQKAADAGDSDSMNGIGYLYQHGLGVAQDYGKAMEWYQKAADAGNSTAMFNIAYMYEHGEGVPANQSTAMEWYQKAADAGDEDAKAKLAQ